MEEGAEPLEHYLWIQVESLQRVDDQGVLCEPVVHDHVETPQERRSLNDGLVVRIIQTLEHERSS